MLARSASRVLVLASLALAGCGQSPPAVTAPAVAPAASSAQHDRCVPSRPIAPGALEIALVDDARDSFPKDEGALPAGIFLRKEAAAAAPGPDGGRSAQDVPYAFVTLLDGESADGAADRVKAWLDSLKIPPGARWAPSEVLTVALHSFGPASRGIRPYLLVGEPLATAADVAGARVEAPVEGAPPAVSVTLDAPGASRFEAATAANLERRLAIVIDGKVVAAPVVHARIPNGHVVITLGSDGTAAEAHRLASLLGGC